MPGGAGPTAPLVLVLSVPIEPMSQLRAVGGLCTTNELARLFQPPKVTHATVEYLDYPSISKEALRDPSQRINKIAATVAAPYAGRWRLWGVAVWGVAFLTTALIAPLGAVSAFPSVVWIALATALLAVPLLGTRR